MSRAGDAHRAAAHAVDPTLAVDGRGARLRPDADEALRAIANPVRRGILRLAWDAERPSAELAEEIRLSRSATSQHLKVLRDAQLVTVRADGAQRLYRVSFETLDGLRRFLDDFWSPRLDRLKAVAEAEASGDRTTAVEQREAST